MIPLNIETIIGKMPVTVAKGSKAKSAKWLALDAYIKGSETAPFVTQWSNNSRLSQDIHEMLTGTKYENDTAEGHAETTKKINTMLKIEKTARKLTNEEVKAIWDEIESMVAPEDFLPVEYDKKGNAFPVYIIKKI